MPGPPGLPQLLGQSRLHTAPARPIGGCDTSEHFWSARSVLGATNGRGQSSPRKGIAAQGDVEMEPPEGGGTAQTRGSTGRARPATMSETSGSLQNMLRGIEKELSLNGLLDGPPSMQRVRIFSSAFTEVIDKLPSYRGLLLSVQKEYEGLISRLTAEVNASASLQGRLKTVRAESLSFVGESVSWLQAEIAMLRQRVTSAGEDLARLREENAKLQEDNEKLQDSSERDAFHSRESHLMNLEILRHMDRLEKHLEWLRKQEQEAQSELTVVQQRCKEKDARIETVENQLLAERARCATMVPREEYEAAREEVRQWEAKHQELSESHQAKQRDYLSIVEAYTRISGQGLEELSLGGARPLTPRPQWHHCRGLLDPDLTNTAQRADIAQELLQHMLVRSRALLAAYGLFAASKKSTTYTSHAQHHLTAPLAASPTDTAVLNVRTPEPSGPDDEEQQIRRPTTTILFTKDGEDWLAPDLDHDTPLQFRHGERVRNLRLSRRRTAELMESLLSMRSQLAVTALARPFATFLLDHLPDGMRGEEAKTFAINVYASVRRHATEPDFLCYLLLLAGRIPDGVVRDSKVFCEELLAVFTQVFQAPEGSRSSVTKQKLFYGLREALPNKSKENWQDLATYLPAGSADLLVNYEWLLFDDLYVFSPIVYALRLQHLDEVLGLIERLEKTVKSTLDLSSRDSRSVTFEAVEHAFHSDQELSLIQPEDLARAFDVKHASDLQPKTRQDVDRFLELVRHGDIFHVLYFPALPGDDAGLEAQGEDVF